MFNLLIKKVPIMGLFYLTEINTCFCRMNTVGFAM